MSRDHYLSQIQKHSLLNLSEKIKHNIVYDELLNLLLKEVVYLQV